MSELVKYDGSVSGGLEINRHNSELLGRGLTEGTVNRVWVTVFDTFGRSRTIPLAEKLFDSPAPNKIPLDVIINNHSELRKRGLPTFPTLRVENREDPNNLFMTDITENGKKEVLSVFDWSEAYGREGKYYGQTKPFHIENIEELNSGIAELYEQTTEKGCVLETPDVFFLVLDKETLCGSLILGDISTLVFVPQDTDIALPFKLRTGQQVNVEDQNYKVFLDFIWRLNEHLDENGRLDLIPLQKKLQELHQRLGRMS